ncbi:MAG: hypothetical protein FWE67_01820 [Planctomycetaceae bacterium]|nr:hypothetical protein [Planctomycetaceae bacterium]
MRLLFTLFILLIPAVLSAQQNIAGVVQRTSLSGGVIYSCLFDDAFDLEDGDGKPDHWQRKHGIDNGIFFPDHIDILMISAPNPFGNHVLRMNIQGGGAAIYTPKINTRPNMCYTASVHVSADKLEFSEVFLMLSFYGKTAAVPLKNISSAPVQNTGGWKKIEVGPIRADHADMSSVSVGLMVVPKSNRNDFNGIVDWTHLEIRESPHVTLSTEAPNHIYNRKTRIGVSCKISGIDPHQQSLDFILEDPFGRVLTTNNIELIYGDVPASQFVFKAEDFDKTFEGRAAWNNLPIVSPGFYRVRIKTPEKYSKNIKLPKDVFYFDPLADSKPLTLAVIEEQSDLTPPIRNGEFGWTLEDWTLDEIAGSKPLFRNAALSQLKIPAWLPSETTAGGNKQLLRLCTSLREDGYKLTGLMSPIPDEVKKKIKRGVPNAAAVFTLPLDTWMPQMQQPLGELSRLVRDWQWTADDDVSLAELPDFTQQFDTYMNNFDSNGYGFGMGLAWNWFQALPVRFSKTEKEFKFEDGGAMNPAQDTTAVQDLVIMQEPANEFVSFYSADPLTPEEMQRYFGSDNDFNRRSGIRRFLSLEPLSLDRYSPEERINDIVKRMVLSRTCGLEAVFLSKPKDALSGVLQPDGTPGELLLPWRTTSAVISGREHLGSINLPNESVNINFLIPAAFNSDTEEAEEQVAGVFWNDTATPLSPIRETLYLGNAPRGINVWGKTFLFGGNRHEHTVEADRTPVFVLGIDADVFRLRQGFRLNTTEVPSISNTDNDFQFSLTNTTNLPFVARLSIIPPETGGWEVSRIEPVLIAPKQTADFSPVLRLQRFANTGRQKFKVNVKASGIKSFDFDIYETLQIGDRNVSLDFSSRMLPNGDIEVIQTFFNNGDEERSYEFRLYVAQRQVLRASVVRQGRGTSEYTYIIPNGRDLLRRGVKEMTVRADPIGQGQPMFYTVGF